MPAKRPSIREIELATAKAEGAAQAAAAADFAWQVDADPVGAADQISRARLKEVKQLQNERVTN